MHKDFEGSVILNLFVSFSILSAIIISLFYQTLFTNVPLSAIFFFYFWGIVGFLFSIITFKKFTIGWLFTFFCMLIAARILALHGLLQLASITSVSLILLFFNFLYCAYLNTSRPSYYLYQLSALEWQLVFIRLYLGFNFVPHFTEKLFAGYASFSADVKDFAFLGVPHPSLFVTIAGLCEFGAAIGLGLGILIRPAAVGAAMYLFIALLLGHHFSLGFIWANSGGGWEFGMLWIVLILSFAFTGDHDFSIDQEIESKYRLPRMLKKLL